MREFKTPRKDDSFDRAAADEVEGLAPVDESPIAPGRRTRTLGLAELLGSEQGQDLARRARDKGAPPSIPQGHAPSSMSGLVGALYRKGAGEVQPGEETQQKVVAAQSSAGQALPAKLRRRLEMALGVDLANVRIHTGRESAEAATGVGALAYTLGQQIHFAHGQYDPDSPSGEKLIAHEVAHTVQQRGMSSLGFATALTVSTPGDAHETEADAFADTFAAGGAADLSPVSRGVVSRAVIHRRKGQTEIIAEAIGTDEAKAKDALRKAGGNRGVVEAAIRRNFDDDDAKEIIESVPAGAGEKPPEVKGADAKAEKKSGDPPAGEAGGGEKKGSELPKAGGGAPSGGKAPGAGGGTGGDQLPEPVTAGEMQLIYQELVEHQAWQAAADNVGEAGSATRALFALEMAGSGFASGFATGFVMGAAMGAVGQLASRYVPIPGLGAIIAGGFAAYGLLTKDWDASFDTIAAFGEGNSTYEVLANSIASISEIIDIVVNVLNVIAGIIGVISALMWIISIITVGAASPLAGTLSAIALGIVTATGILDNINNLLLQPLVLVFRALHTFTSDADPREVEEQGKGIYDAANKAGNALGGIAGSKAADAGGAKVKRYKHKRAQARGDAPASSTVDAPHPVSTGQAHAEAPAGAAPRADAPDAPGAAPRADTPDAPAGTTPRADTPDGPAGGAPRTDGPDAPRTDGPDAPRTDGPDAPQQRPADAPDPQRAAQAEADVQTRMDKVREGMRRRKEVLKKEFTDHWEAKAKAETELQQRLDRAEVEARQQATADADAARGRTREQAQRDFDDAVRRGKEHAETESGNQHRRDMDAARAKRLSSEQAANKAHSDASLEASAQRRADKSQALTEHSNARRNARDARAELHSEYRDGQRRLRDADATPEQLAQHKAQYEAQRAEIDAEMRAAELTYQERMKQADATYEAEMSRAREARDRARDARTEAFDQDVRTAEEMRVQRQQALDEAAQRAAAEAKSKAETDADRAREGAEKDIDRAGRRAASDERTAKANEDRFGEREDPRGIGQKLWDFYSGTKARQDLGKTWDKAKADEAAMTEGVWEKQGDGSSRWRAEIDTMRERTSVRQMKGDPTASKGGKILTPLKKPTQGLIQSILPEPPKSNEAKFVAGTEPTGQLVVKGERLNPHYSPPPGSPQDLAKIMEYIEKNYEKKSEAEAAERDAATKKAQSEGDAPRLAQLQAEGVKAQQVNSAHQSAVAQKEAANTEQKGRQGEAKSTIDGYAGKAAGLSAITTPMAAFAKFTYIGEKLGVDSFGKMNKDITKILGQFKQMDATMKAQSEAQPANKAKLDAEGQRIKATDAQAKQTEGSLTDTDAKTKELNDANTQNIQDGAAAEGEAAQQKAKHGQQAKTGEQAYNQLRGQLVSWATQHKAQRDAAVAKQAGRPAPQSSAQAQIDHGTPAGGDAGDTGGPAPAPAPAGADGAPPAPAPAAQDQGPQPAPQPDAAAPPQPAPQQPAGQGGQGGGSPEPAPEPAPDLDAGPSDDGDDEGGANESEE